MDGRGRVSAHSGLQAWLRVWIRSGRLYAVLAALISGVVLLSGLTRFPLQVTADEVYPSLRGMELADNHFKGEDGELLPVFLRGSTPFAIGDSATIQALPQFFRPNALAWIRGLNAALGLLAATLLAAWLWFGLRLKYAWAMLPLLAGIPAWFYFSRTGLDIALAASFSTAALGCYGFYRAGRVKCIYGAVIFAILAFYTTPAARLAVPSAVVLLAAADWRTHRKNLRPVLGSLLLAAVMAAPLGIFLARHPDGIRQEWLAAGSFLTTDLTPWLKLGRFLLNTLNAFNPLYWFLPDPTAAAYNRMGSYPAQPYWLTPFIVVGAVAALRKLREPAYRNLWLAWLAAAIGAAPYGGRLPELLPAVTVLAVMGVIGLEAAACWLQAKWKPLPAWLPGAMLLAAAGVGCLGLWADGLFFNARWQVDYGKNGLQYGAPQIYGAAAAYASQHPDRSVMVWPDWSNDPEALRQFFVPGNDERVQLGRVDAFLYAIDPAVEAFAFVLPEEQVVMLQDNRKFEVVPIDRITYPNGAPAFGLVELSYTQQAAAIMEQEAARRRVLVEEAIQLDGELITARHSVFDLGGVENLFDGSADSLARTAEANPLVIELVFPMPRRISGVILRLGSEPVMVTAITNPGMRNAQTVSVHGEAVEGMKDVGITLDEDIQVEVLRLEVMDESAQEPAHVHLWEIRLIEK